MGLEDSSEDNKKMVRSRNPQQMSGPVFKPFKSSMTGL